MVIVSHLSSYRGKLREMCSFALCKMNRFVWRGTPIAVVRTEFANALVDFIKIGVQRVHSMPLHVALAVRQIFFYLPVP